MAPPVKYNRLRVYDSGPVEAGANEEMMRATIHSWSSGVGDSIPYAQLEDGEILHLHHLCGREEGESTEVVVIARDHESPIRAISVNNRKTMILNGDQTAYIHLSNKALLDRKVSAGEWVILR